MGREREGGIVFKVAKPLAKPRIGLAPHRKSHGAVDHSPSITGSTQAATVLPSFSAAIPIIHGSLRQHNAHDKIKEAQKISTSDFSSQIPENRFVFIGISFG